VLVVCCHDAALSAQVSPHVLHVIGKRSDGSDESPPRTERKETCPVIFVCCHDSALSAQVSPHVLHVIGNKSDGSDEAKPMSAARWMWSMLRAC